MKKLVALAVAAGLIIFFSFSLTSCSMAGYAAGYVIESSGNRYRADGLTSSTYWDPGEKRYYREDKNGRRVYE